MAPITCSVINAVANGKVSFNDQTTPVENEGYLLLTSDWARNVLNEIERDVKHMVHLMVNIAKNPVASAILNERKLYFQREVKSYNWHNIPDGLITNL